MASQDQALTERQQQVLKLTTEGKNPTEIGEALGISSQAVHGHFRRLRAHGLLNGGTSAPAPSSKHSIAATLKSAMSAIDRTIAEQRKEIERSIAQLERNREQFKAQITKIDQDKREAEKALKELDGVRERAGTQQPA
jgi:predicted ArsR family transcriptional regulator